VTFEVEIVGGKVRLAGTDEWRVRVTSEPLPCRPTGTPAFLVEIQAAAVKRVQVVLTLFARGAKTLQETLELKVAIVAPEESGGAGGNAPEPAPQGPSPAVSHSELGSSIPVGCFATMLNVRGSATAVVM
jgi:hypothetical protein